jgi:outer membrane protein OmpA-like peptidoglycan-associated protein
MRRAHLRTAAALFALAVALPGSAAAQAAPGHVRVVGDSGRIQRSFHIPELGILAVVQTGTVLDVLDQEPGWFWVVTPADARGTRKGGWIRASEVEVYVPPPPPAPAGQTMPAAEASPDSAAALSAGSADDKVTFTMSRDGSATPGADTPARAYDFADVHFDRDRSSLRQEDMATLQRALSALKADPALVLRLEGHTCSLGSSKYNLELGMRRAEAVKGYLVGEGIAGDRLRTASRGEEHAQHDNSREESRRLNRRVAIIPGGQP